MQTHSDGGRGQREYSWRKYLMVGIYDHGKHGSKMGDLGRWIVLEKMRRAAIWNRLGKISTQSVGT